MKKLIYLSDLSKKPMSTPLSPLMDELYGTELSKQVYSNIENLDSDLNKEVQEIAYEHYWARPGLSIRDKSLITVASLIALRKEKQTKPHMIGFFNTGGTKEELISVLLFLTKKLDSKYTEKALAIYYDILKEKGVNEESLKQFQLSLQSNSQIESSSNRDSLIAHIAACAAIGDQEKTEFSIKTYLQSITAANINDVRNTLIHLIAYCGFPVAINGFSALKKVLEET